MGIAHLLDPFGEDVVSAVTSVQPTERIDHSLVAAARDVVEREDPDLLVLQLLAADQLGHVRGVRNREYIDQLEDTDRHVAGFLAWLGERGKLDDATVILMADHGQGRGIGGHGHLDWGETPVPFVVHGEGAVPGAVSREPHNVCELAATVSALLGVEPPASARGRALVPALDPALSGVWRRTGQTPKRCLAIIPAKDEAPVIGPIVERIPSEACGMSVDTLVIDDGSRDDTAAIARAAGAEVVSNPDSTGLGAAVRQGLAAARDRGYDAAVYLDGDGEYDPADFERVLEPVARGRAEYVVGSRFLGTRDGMTWHRALANRLTSALLGTLMETVVSDGQSGYRAFGRRALVEARIRHDYNYAQVLTLSLWGAGIDPVEVPIDYRRRQVGRSFVRYPEYFARVVPALWREWRHARRQRATSPAPSGARHDIRHRCCRRRTGRRPRAGPRARPAARPPARRRPSARPRRARPKRRSRSAPAPSPCAGSGACPTPRAARRAAALPAGAGRGTRSRTSWGRGTRRPGAARRARACRAGRRPRRARAGAARGRAPRAACARASRSPRRRAGRRAPSAPARTRGR